MAERTLLDRLTPRSILLAGYGSAIVVLLLGVLVYFGSGRLAAAYNGVYNGQQLLRSVRQLDESLDQAEIHHRSYLLTNNDVSRSGFERIALQLPVLLEGVKKFAVNVSDSDSDKVDTLAFYARLRMAELDQEARRYKDVIAKGVNPRDLQSEFSSSKLRFNQIAQSLYAHVDGQTGAAWTLGQQELRRAGIVVLGGAFASVVLIVVFTLLSRKQARHQARIHHELEEQSIALKIQAAEARAANIELESATREMVSQAAEAEANQLRLSGILGSVTDAVVSFDDERRVVYINAAAERLLGVAASEAVGVEVTSFVPEDLREQFRSNISSARFALPVVSDEVRRYGLIINRAGSEAVPVDISIAYAQATERQGLYTAIIRDVSRQRQLEEQLRQSQKMEAVGRLAGGIAHDFNNLLTVIGASSDFILQRRNIDPDTIREDIVEIRKATDRAAALTRQLLAFSRRQLVHPQVTDIKLVVEEMKSMLQRLIGEDITLVTNYSKTSDFIKIDRGQLEQVIANLSVNARDSMPEGGSLEIRTEIAAEAEHAALAIEGDTGKGFVVLVVKDSGSGMPKEVQARIFEPFFTTKERGKGTGLGLPTVYGIVKQAGGDVVVESTPGVGTEFRLYFPLVEEEAVGVDPQLPIAASTFRGNETILIVEDEGSLRHLAHRILQSRGYTVLEAANGQDAINVMARHGQQIDLVVSDVVMPVMGGRELVERLLPIYPMLRILFMTGYTEDTLLKHRISELGITVLEKPFTPETLARSVRTALDRGHVRRPTLVETKTA